jgi:hypothetical protein
MITHPDFQMRTFKLYKNRIILCRDGIESFTKNFIKGVLAGARRRKLAL